MRKTLALVVSITFLGSLLSIPAFGAVKAGASCTKAGSTSTALGKKFTCIKSGKKLVWNKGVAIAKPTSESVATPSPAPSPTQTEAPAQVPVGLWQETQFKILAQFKQLKPASIQEINFVLSPNADLEVEKKLQDSYRETINYLSNLYVNSNKVKILVMNENDRDWWVSKLKELGSLQPSDLWGTRCQVNSQTYCAYASSNKDGTLHVGHITGSDLVWRELNYAKTYHEAIHVYQLSLMGNRMDALPSWFAEGQANYLGYTFSNRFINSKQQRNSEIVRLKSFPNVEIFDDMQWYEFIQRADSDRAFTSEGSLGYSLGELILESLYNKHDFRKVHDWMVAIKNGSDYKTGFKSVFGQDYDSWLRETAAPYLNSQI
jgi:hypothetical protein